MCSKFGRTTPILRIFDEAKTKEFYVGFLGFNVDWEHRFEPGLPLYMQISRDGCVLHLSEHHGDCSPGAAMRIEASDLDAFHRELTAKQYRYARPGIEEMPWGSRDMSVKDPFGNRADVYQCDQHLTDAADEWTPTGSYNPRYPEGPNAQAGRSLRWT